MATATITDISTIRTTPVILLATVTARVVTLDPYRIYTLVNLAIDGTAGYATASTGVVFCTTSLTTTSPTAPVTSTTTDDDNLIILSPSKAVAIGPHINKIYIDATASVLVQVIPTEKIFEA